MSCLLLCGVLAYYLPVSCMLMFLKSSLTTTASMISGTNAAVQHNELERKLNLSIITLYLSPGINLPAFRPMSPHL